MANNGYYENGGSDYLNRQDSVSKEKPDVPSHNHDERYYTKEIVDAQNDIYDENFANLAQSIDDLNTALSNKADINHTHAAVSSTSAGFMTPEQMQKLDSALTSGDIQVTSVNGETGDVLLSAADVQARPDTWAPTPLEIGAATEEHIHENANSMRDGFMASSDYDKLFALPNVYNGENFDMNQQQVYNALHYMVADRNNDGIIWGLTDSTGVGALQFNRYNAADRTYIDSPFSIFQDGTVDYRNNSWVHAYSNAVQSIPANTTTKLNFAAEKKDLNAEFSGSTFKAKAAGIYQVTTYIDHAAITGTARIFLNLYKNGVEDATIAGTTPGSGLMSAISGSCLVELAINDTLDIRMWTSLALSTRARGQNYDYVQIKRIV